MSLQEEIVATLQSAPPGEAVRLDPAVGRRWCVSLQRALGGEVAESTDYLHGRAYCLDHRLPLRDDWPWRATLRVRISGIGPFATQVFIQSKRQGNWWTGAISTHRRGWLPEHGEVLTRLRKWYADNGLKEVDPVTAAQPAPAGTRVPGFRGSEVVLFEALFHG